MFEDNVHVMKRILFYCFPPPLDAERELTYCQVLGECTLLLQPRWTTGPQGVYFSPGYEDLLPADNLSFHN